jgi:thiol-disulfide isomerase/thioredoxin
MVAPLVLLLLSLMPARQAPPAPPAGTPSECVRAVEDFRARRQKEAPRPLTAEIVRQIDAEKTAMAGGCAAKFEPATVPPAELGSLVQLYVHAGQPEQARKAIDHGLRTLPPDGRAAFLPVAITTILRGEPKSAARNARLEQLVDGYYRGDDIDAGIVKHSTWIMKAAGAMTPDERKRLGYQVVSAYRNMAQALAGQGKNDEALALLRQAKSDLADVPRINESMDPEIARYALVGTPAAPVAAPVWLNAPEGTTEMSMKGPVTLLEFTAHWCGPCRESYPGINRLREKYGRDGFRVVLATQLYGYFGSERQLDAAAEIARDRTYFAEHHMNVPIAIGPQRPEPVRGSDGRYTFRPDPNDENYKVGGIPQIHLIDRQGRIRLIMVGYDEANEERLGSMIQAMLRER